MFMLPLTIELHGTKEKVFHNAPIPPLPPPPPPLLNIVHVLKVYAKVTYFLA